MATAKTLQRQDVAQPTGPVSPPATLKPAPSVTPEQIAIVKATAPVLREHGVAITTLFYKNMIDENPELKNVFSLTSQATGAQPRALAGAVLSYAMFIDDLPRLRHAVERIAHKHASLQIVPAQYDIVGKYLIEAIGLVLGDAATPPIVDAWTAAYGVLASVFIGREHTLYEEARTRDNNKGWAGWRKFRVQRREYAASPDEEITGEKDGILSLYLAPVDGKPLPTYEPGQYVSLQVFIPEFGVFQSRQYSLSQAPRAAGDYYRISVKRDNGNNGLTEPGRISNLLHKEIKEGDEVELSQPQGEFVVEETPVPTAENAKKPASTESLAPLVLLSAGVGATPVMAILETAAQQGRTISWLHGSHSRSVLPFSKEVQAIRAAHPERILTHTVLSTDEEAPAATSTAGDPVVTGTHLKIAEMADTDRKRLLFLDDARTGYYICGPSSFMVESRDTLQGLGVAPERIHLELFDTGDL
ncbi:hypothetical protein Sste5346_003842 [Sporothrix stenoceras]|uniref:nitric oxide dioxygenase n=1 Tax=Sporothrix stenoceras TaxID=5173 RepID=A0ABR3ZD38_9PEZI